MQVRATTTHTQPGSGAYRAEGEEFEHNGPLYEHVEPVNAEEANKADEPRRGSRRSSSSEKSDEA